MNNNVNIYYDKINEARFKIEKYVKEIFKVYGNELLLRLEEYNLLENENNCIESSTATGFIIEEFITSKLRTYTKGHTNDELTIQKHNAKTINTSYDCFSKYKDILIMINIKVDKGGNNAVASINRLYEDYVKANGNSEKAYLVLKIGYKYDVSKEDKQRKIFITGVNSYFLEEFDFSKGYSQDNRNWRKSFNKNSGRLQLRDTDPKLSYKDIGYNRTKNFLMEIYNSK